MEDNRNYLPRTMKQLEDAGYSPVWSREEGYPGEIPEEIAEYLDDNSYRKQTSNFGAVLIYRRPFN